MSNTVTIVSAAQVRVGDRLLARGVGVDPWAGPEITSVQVVSGRVTIRTWNGGMRSFAANAPVEVVR